MPNSAHRPCTHTGCSELSTTGKCDKHKHDGWNRHQAGRTSTERGYGTAWRKLRAKVMKRDNYLCQVCLPQMTKAKEVDHITNKAKGGTDDMDNLQAICIGCHRAKTANE